MISKSYFKVLSQKKFNCILIIFVFIFTIIFSKFSLWFDVNSFYTNLLRNFEGQIFLKDYFCQFFPIQFYIFSPLLNFFNLDTFIILFSVILNFLFAYQFTYYSKKILNKEFEFFGLFILLSFFFIPFGIGSAHHNELSIYFCTIGFLMAISNLNKFSFTALFYLTFGLVIKYSIAIPIFGAIFFSFFIVLAIRFNKDYFYLFLKYFFSIIILFIFIIFVYTLRSQINLHDVISFLFIDPLILSKSRITLDSFIFLNVFRNIFNFFFNFTGLKSFPVGSFLQLPIILGYIIFIYFILKKGNNFSVNEKIYFIFLMFASMFLFVSLGRDWNHKIIYFLITNYMAIFYFTDLEKKISKNKINLIFCFVFGIYLFVPINERIPLKNLIDNSSFNSKDYFFKFSEESPYIALKRSIFEDTNGIINLNEQYAQISNYLNDQKNLNLFYLDDISTIFSSILSKASKDPGCIHAWMFTPPLNKKIRNEWINVYEKNYYKLENSKLIVCKTDDGKLCIYSPILNENDEMVAVGPTDIEDNIFIKKLLSNSKISFRTKNFYIYEKKK